MACPFSVVKKLHVALLQFLFVHKHLILSRMCFGFCPWVKYRNFRVTMDTPERLELLIILLNDVYVNMSRVFRLVQ
jgi:hypothetical protein